MRTTQTSAVGGWKKAGLWLLTAAPPDPGSVPEEPNDLISCVRPVWSCLHCFCFGVTTVSDRNNFKVARTTRLMVSEGRATQSTAAEEDAGARGGKKLQRPVTVNRSPQTRLYLLKLRSSLNPALSAGSKPTADFRFNPEYSCNKSPEDS